MNSFAFERHFEAGDSVLASLAVASVRRPRLQQTRVIVDFPLWMVEQFDLGASCLGVSRQSIVKVWLSEWGYLDP